MWANAPQFPRSLFATLMEGIAGFTVTGSSPMAGSAKRDAAGFAWASLVP